MEVNLGEHTWSDTARLATAQPFRATQPGGGWKAKKDDTQVHTLILMEEKPQCAHNPCIQGKHQVVFSLRKKKCLQYFIRIHSSEARGIVTTIFFGIGRPTG